MKTKRYWYDMVVVVQMRYNSKPTIHCVGSWLEPEAYDIWFRGMKDLNYLVYVWVKSALRAEIEE